MALAMKIILTAVFALMSAALADDSPSSEPSACAKCMAVLFWGGLIAGIWIWL